MNHQAFVQVALNSNFYQKKLAGLNRTNWNDIPFTTKQELRNANPYEVLGIIPEKIATYHETSGTTGTPAPSWFSSNDIQLEADVLLRSDIKLNEKDLILNRFPFAVALPAFIVYWAASKVKAGHIGVDQWNHVTPLRRVMEIIEKAKPTILALGPTEAVKLYQTGRQMGRRFPIPGLRALILAGEIVSPARRKYLEKLWGIPVYLFFGSTETGGLFVTCKEGHYHLNHPKVMVEAVDDKGYPVPSHITGNCVISTAREGMPLLRYFNEDRIAIHEESCHCGNSTPFLVHYGRKEDAITAGGKTFSLFDIQEAVYSLSEVPFMWKLQAENGKITFIMQYVKETNIDAIQRELSAKLGIDLSILLQDLIPTDSLIQKPAFGKYAYIEKLTREDLIHI